MSNQCKAAAAQFSSPRLWGVADSEYMRKVLGLVKSWLRFYRPSYEGCLIVLLKSTLPCAREVRSN